MTALEKTGAFVMCLVALGLAFLCVDCCAGRDRYFECEVSAHRHVEAWTQFITSTDSDGHVHVSTIHHPEEWRLSCEQLDGNQEFDVETSWDTFHNTTNQQAVTVRTREGRWTGIQHIPQIE